MSPFAPYTEAQFQYLAMGKARAYSWETLAQQIEMPIEIVERVAWTHEKLWNRHLTKAERLIARETISEVAVVLRSDIRNAEPQHHATLTNSLTCLLKLQQDYAPPPRRPHVPNAIPVPSSAPIVTPVPATPTPTPSPTPAASGPSLGANVASVLGFFLLLAALFVVSWKLAPKLHERADFVTREPIATLVAVTEPHDPYGPTTRLVLTPPPWVRES